MVKKLIQQLILAGLRRNPTGKRFTQFCLRVKDSVDNDILGRLTCNAEIGQWRVPLDKKNAKKLGNIKLSGAYYTKLMDGLNILL